MYRIIHLRRLFELLEEHDFGGETCALRLTVRDTLLPEENGGLMVRFERGRARVVDDGETLPADAEMRVNVAELSSLLMGCVSYRALHRLGLAWVSDPARVDQIDRLLSGRGRPICMTAF